MTVFLPELRFFLHIREKKAADWYKGTANAIYQNLDFINRYDPDYVLVLSGDHIYKMDYSKMLDYHKRMGADVTIAVLVFLSRRQADSE